MTRRRFRLVAMTALVMAYAVSMTTAAAPTAEATPAQNPVGVGPLGITFNLTDENGKWFDSGLNLFGSHSLAVAVMPRVGTDVGVPSVGGPLLESDLTGLTDPLTGGLLGGDLTGGLLGGDLTGGLPVGGDLTGGLLGGDDNPLAGVLGEDAATNSLVAGLNLDDTLATVEGLAQTDSEATALATEAEGLIGQLTDQLSALPVDAPVSLDTLPVGVDLQGVLDQLSELAVEGPPIPVTFNVDPSRSEGIRNPIGLIAPEGAEGFPYMDGEGAFFGEKTIQLTEPGLYAFQESVAPYMLGAVVVDDPLTLGLDFGERLMINGQEQSVSSNSDIIQRLVGVFFTATNPNNWQTYSETGPASYNPFHPPAPILQYDEAGNQVLIPNLDAYYDEYFGYPREFPAINQTPAVPGVGEVWVDTEVEEYAGKTKTGAATRINTEDWTVDRKISGSAINMNNPHNMWTDANYQYLYQSEWWDDEIDVFDRETGELVHNTQVGPNPAHIMTRPGSDELVVGLNAGREIVELAPGGGSVTRRIDVDPDNPMTPHPHAHWTSYDGSTVVAPNTMTNEAVIVDMESGTVRHEPVGYFPIATSMLPDGSAAYLSDFLGMSITCVSMAQDACGTPDGGVAHSETIDLWQNYDMQTGPATDATWGGLTIQLPVSPDGEAMVAANTLSQTISIIDPETNTVVKDLPCNAGCHGANFGAKQGGGYYAYVSNKFSNVMQVVDVDPNLDGDISDAEVAGQLVLAPDADTAMEDTLTQYPGFGGQGVLPIPLVNNGWSQLVPPGWRDQLTCEQLNPIDPSAC